MEKKILELKINNKEKDIDFHVEGELTIPELNVRGFYDIIVDDKTEDRKVYLYDIKTCGGYAWKMKFGRNKKLDPSTHYELQLGTYGYAIKEMFGQLDGMYLYYYNKDNSDMRAVEVPLTYVSRAYLFWKNINDEHKWVDRLKKIAKEQHRSVSGQARVFLMEGIVGYESKK